MSHVGIPFSAHRYREIERKLSHPTLAQRGDVFRAPAGVRSEGRVEDREDEDPSIFGKGVRLKTGSVAKPCPRCGAVGEHPKLAVDHCRHRAHRSHGGIAREQIPRRSIAPRDSAVFNQCGRPAIRGEIASRRRAANQEREQTEEEEEFHGVSA
jgi:hypothetical protein